MHYQEPDGDSLTYFESILSREAYRWIERQLGYKKNKEAYWVYEDFIQKMSPIWQILEYEKLESFWRGLSSKAIRYQENQGVPYDQIKTDGQFIQLLAFYIEELYQTAIEQHKGLAKINAQSKIEDFEKNIERLKAIRKDFRYFRKLSKNHSQPLSAEVCQKAIFYAEATKMQRFYTNSLKPLRKNIKSPSVNNQAFIQAPSNFLVPLSNKLKIEKHAKTRCYTKCLLFWLRKHTGKPHVKEVIIILTHLNIEPNDTLSQEAMKNLVHNADDETVKELLKKHSETK